MGERVGPFELQPKEALQWRSASSCPRWEGSAEKHWCTEAQNECAFQRRERTRGKEQLDFCFRTLKGEKAVKCKQLSSMCLF